MRPNGVRPLASDGGLQRGGGIAALYIALADLLAIPYFLVMVNYPGVDDPMEKVSLLRDNRTSLYLVHIVCFELTALGFVVVTLALHRQLREASPSIMPVATSVGLIRASLLFASVMVFNYGMDQVVDLYATSPDRAASAWQAIEPVAYALGGSGGDLLGGVWYLSVNVTAMRAGAFPRPLSVLGATIGIAGIVAAASGLSAVEDGFEALQIVWFAWFGILTVRRSRSMVGTGLGPGGGAVQVHPDKQRPGDAVI